MFSADRVLTTTSMANSIRRQTRPQGIHSRRTNGNSQGRPQGAVEAAEVRSNVEPSPAPARNHAALGTGRGRAHRTAESRDSRKRSRTGQDGNHLRKRHGSRRLPNGTEEERLGIISEQRRAEGVEDGEDHRNQHTDRAGDENPRVVEPREKGRPKKRKEVPGWETCQSSIRCDFCQSDLTTAVRHECHLCRFRLCCNCVWNAEVLYEHGPDHVCAEVQPGSEAGKEPTADNETRTRLCDVCGADLRDVRYDCQECSGVSLCEDDYRDGLHIPGHTLKRFPQPADDSAHLASARPSGEAQDMTYEQVAEDGAHESSDDTEEIGSGESDSPDGDVPSCVAQGSQRDDVDADGNESCMELGDTHSRPPPRRPRLRPAPPRVLDKDRINLSLTPEEFSAFSVIARLVREHSESHGRSSEAHRSTPKTAGRTKRSRPEGAKSGTTWLDEDLEELQNLKDAGVTDVEIARILDRSVGAIVQQWRKMVDM